MTKAKPLSAEEIAAVFDAGAGWCSDNTFACIRATIEQQAEQIVKLRETVSDVRITLTVDGRYPTMVERCDKALAAREHPK